MSTLGGVFLATRDPARLLDWFEHYFGFTFERHGGGGHSLLAMKDGVAVFGIQPARSDAPTPPAGDVVPEPYGRQPMMLNLRVDDLDATLAALADGGQGIAGPADYEGLGRFAWTRTPDGHDVEIWQA